MRLHWAYLGVLIILVPMLPAADADWPQYGKDAARTAALDGPGPAWRDVALQGQLALPEGASVGGPIVVGDEVFVPVELFSFDLTGSLYSRSGELHAINLTDGSTHRVAESDVAFQELAADGDQLYGVGHKVVVAFNRNTGAEAWRGDVGSERVTGPAALESQCAAPLLAEDTLFVACTESEGGASIVLLNGFSKQGKPLWESPFLTPTANRQIPCPATAPDVQCLLDSSGENFNPDLTPYCQLGRQPALSFVAQRIVLVQSSSCTTQGRSAGQPTDLYYGRVEVYVITLAGEGQLLYQGWHSGGGSSGGFPPMGAPAPTGDERIAFVKTERLRRYDADNLVSGQPRPTFDDWTEGTAGRSAGMAFTGQALFAATQQAVYKLTPDLKLDPRFMPLPTPVGAVWGAGPILAFEGQIIARSEPVDFEASSTLVAIDDRNGAVRWQYTLKDNVRLAGLRQGIVAVAPTGFYTVLGTLPVSPSIQAAMNGLYPAPGDLVRVNLAKTEPGLSKQGLEYAAIWGDETETDWQASPVLTHAYRVAGEAPARFFVRNAANQTASLAVTFLVGAHDPAVTIWNSPLDREYQDTTFFVLGLLATGVLALFGIYRAGRKRRLFERELRDLEADHRNLAKDAHACDAMLAERRSQARALFLEKRLEESHSSFLVGRIDELRKGLRLGAVEQRLKFLPYGMVLQLQRLLSDARVDEWERDHLLAALEQEKSLNAAQRREVRALIDGWFARDSHA